MFEFNLKITKLLTGNRSIAKSLFKQIQFDPGNDILTADQRSDHLDSW